MRKLFTDWKISTALDSGRDRSGGPVVTASAGESDDFARACSDLEHSLREQKPAADAPPFLHAAIMRRLESGAASARPAETPAWRHWWVPASAVALVVGCLVWWTNRPTPFVRPSADLSALSLPASAIQAGSEIAQTVPAKVVSPLAEELESLQKDFQVTSQFLLANIP